MSSLGLSLKSTWREERQLPAGSLGGASSEYGVSRPSSTNVPRSSCRPEMENADRSNLEMTETLSLWALQASEDGSLTNSESTNHNESNGAGLAEVVQMEHP
jgi:hypothetical protein